MDKFFYILLLGVINMGPSHVSGSRLEFTATAGDNVTLYCDCNKSSGVYITWYRNCSHGNQPSLVLNTEFPHKESPFLDIDDIRVILNPFPRLHLVENWSSNSYDLLIVSVTDSDEGLYYCGTKEFKVDTRGEMQEKYIYSYSNVTARIKLSEPQEQTRPDDSGVCRRLLLFLCPACAAVSFFSSLLVHHLCKKAAKKRPFHGKRSKTRGHRRKNKDEDTCYAALDMQTSQKSKTPTQSSTFCTYSDINTCRM